MSRLLRAALAAIALIAFTAPSRAAAPVPPEAGKAITFPFPAKAPVVVQLNGLGGARERLTTMLKAALPNDAAALNKQIDAALDELFTGRKLTAIPKDGRIFFVINDIASLFDGTPTVSLLVPVTSYKEFRESFLTAEERKTFEAGRGVDEVKVSYGGEEHAVFMVDLKEYVAISPDKGTADIYATKYTKATTAAMAQEVAKTFVTSDLSVYVNMDVINDLYGDQIRAFKGLFDFGIQQAQMGGMLPGITKKQLEGAKLLFKGMFQGVEDCRALILAVEFRPEGLNLRLQAQFAEDTDSYALLKAEKPDALSEVGKLPAGLGQYGGLKYGKKFVEVFRGLNAEFAPADDDDKGNDAIDKRMKELAAAGRLSELSGSAAPDTSITVATYAEPTKAATALLGCYQAMSAGGRVQSVVLKNAPKVTEGAKKYRGFTFAEVALGFDYEATVKELPEEAKEYTLAQIKRLVPEKATIWIGTDGKSLMQIMGKDWDTAAGVIDRYLDNLKPISNTDGYKLTRKHLPQEASLLYLLETGQTVIMLTDMLRAMEGTIPGFPKIGKRWLPKGEPSFIGIAVTMKGDTATANVFVPGPALAAGRQLIAELFLKID